MDEQWKPIASLHNKYEASTKGRIRHSKSQRIKAIVFDGHYCKFGYDYNFDGGRYRGWMRVHKAVAETFIENPLGKPTVNHKDGNPKNNSVGNLEWATAKEQSDHAAKVLHRNCGENHYASKFTNQDIKDARELYYEGWLTTVQLAQEYHTSVPYMRRILNGERWKHID